MNGTVVFFIFMMLIFLVLNGLMVAGIVIESNKLKTCENVQSIFCPALLCNFVDSPSTMSNACGGYAYRFIDGDKTNTNDDNIQCSSA